MVIKVKIFLDYICPFCYMGYGIINELSKNYDIDLEYFVFEIHPDTNEKGEDLKKRFPVTNQLYKGLRERGREFGIKYGDVKLLANSKKVLLAAEYAKEIGKIDKFSIEIFKAYFEQCLNIGEEKIINQIAKNTKIDNFDIKKIINDKKYTKLLEEDLKEAKKYKINSVPTFIINGKYKIVGAQSLETFKEVFEKISKENKKNKKNGSSF